MLGSLERLNAFINDSPTVTEYAGATLAEPAHKAVAYDADGNAILATNGVEAFGVILSDTRDPVKQGQPLNILIKNIGLLEAGSAIYKGDPITINTAGQGVRAIAGQFIFGWAFTTVDVGGCVQVMITRSGFMA